MVTKMNANLGVAILFLVVLLLVGLLNGCGSGSGDSETVTDDTADVAWLIPQGEVKDGGPGKDGIPSIDAPKFVTANSVAATAMANDTLVVGTYLDGVAKAYPHEVLDWHEVVNDLHGATPVTLSYCPLTGSAIGWKNNSANGDSTFGVSGLLYNSNLILYDRQTGSNWSQMQQRAVSGLRAAESLASQQVLTIETTWEQWRRWFPDTLLLSQETGFSRSYGVYPYGDYLTSPSTLFATRNSDDTRLFAKSRALGVFIDDSIKVYQISSFEADYQVINDRVGDQDVVVIGSAEGRFALAFSRQFEGEALEFQAIYDGQRLLIRDQLGRQWDLFGVGVSEDVSGERLDFVTHYTAFWFAWTAFFDDIEIHLF